MGSRVYPGCNFVHYASQASPGVTNQKIPTCRKKSYERKPRFPLIRGADGEIRTHDLPLTRRLLCQLSYVGKLVREIAHKGRVFEGP